MANLHLCLPYIYTPPPSNSFFINLVHSICFNLQGVNFIHHGFPSGWQTCLVRSISSILISYLYSFTFFFFFFCAPLGSWYSILLLTCPMQPLMNWSRKLGEGSHFLFSKVSLPSRHDAPRGVHSTFCFPLPWCQFSCTSVFYHPCLTRSSPFDQSRKLAFPFSQTLMLVLIERAKSEESQTKKKNEKLRAKKKEKVSSLDKKITRWGLFVWRTLGTKSFSLRLQFCWKIERGISHLPRHVVFIRRK